MTPPSEDSQHSLPPWLGDSRLPRYAARLLALHKAYGAELEQMLRALPIGDGERVLDVASGDGSYAIMLSRLGARPECLDIDPAFNALAERRCRDTGVNLHIHEGDAMAMPFPDDSYDGSVCAQSFYTLSDTERVLREMKRVVTPGGWVAVAENDRMHQLILPWPPELEMKLRLAEYRFLTRGSDDESPYYMARNLATQLEAVGLESVVQRSFCAHRRAPLGQDERFYLSEYLREVREFARPELSGAEIQQVEAFTMPDSPRYLLDRKDFCVTHLTMLAWGRVPKGPVEST